MFKMVQVKDITYDLRNSSIFIGQPKFNKITYSKMTFCYYIMEHISGTHYPKI